MDGRPVLRRKEEDDIEENERPEQDEREHSQSPEEEHEREQDGKHGFHRVFPDDRPCKDRGCGNFYAVRAHQTDGKDLFADCLPVLQKQRNDKLEDEIAERR